MGKTRGVHETTPEIRNRMVGMYEAGLGLKEIAAAVNCSQRTVKRWLNRFDREGHVDTRDRCGRKRATTQEQDQAIVRLATQTPITAAKAVLPALGLNCSVDTVRERLHKAGIHNWSPSRKHIQKIPIAPTDGAGIQQAVWRPTGTQLGKKKSTKEPTKSRASNSSPRSNNRTLPRKAKSKNKQSVEEDEPPDDTANQTQVQQQQQQQQIAPTHINQMQALPPPPPAAPTVAPAPHPLTTIPSNSSHYSHPLNLIPQSQPIYHHQPALSVSQNWPLDLVQGAHHYAQTQPTAIHPEQQAPMHIQSQPQIHVHHDAPQLSHYHHASEQIPTVQQIHCDLGHQKLDGRRITVVDNSQQDGQFSRTEDGIGNACIDVCSNSSTSSNGNSQHSSVDDGLSSDNDSGKRSKASKKRKSKSKTKKGGKIKGTLETSVEIRNRMIGMSEAGLSTLSIALAINRSERTVKRWLDRWHKEGNVQTKERKGRRRITTKEEDDAIIALATQQPLTAAKHVAPALGLKCSVDTIRERLHRAGIHSWKLGKKQGQGNAVHTVHLWQPSGNRSNKLKTGGNKKRKPPNKQRNQHADQRSKEPRKKVTDETPPEMLPSTTTTAFHQEPSLQFQNQTQSPTIMQTSHELSSTTSEFIQPRQHLQPPLICTQGSLPPQTLQANMGPIMQPRPDCRLSLSALAPPISSQPSNNISYSSCMLGNGAHPTHIEQADPMNYEPYIWSF